MSAIMAGLMIFILINIIKLFEIIDIVKFMLMTKFRIQSVNERSLKHLIGFIYLSFLLKSKVCLFLLLAVTVKILSL